MRHLLILSMACLLLAAHGSAAAAVTVVECLDEGRTNWFRDTCPPGATKTGEREIRGVGGEDGPSLEEIAEQNPITLYTVPDCNACDLVRHVLSSRQLPFTEKDVQDNGEMQEELKSMTGALTVPAMVVGEKVATGYSRAEIDGALRAAGYPEPETP